MLRVLLIVLLRVLLCVCYVCICCFRLGLDGCIDLLFCLEWCLLLLTMDLWFSCWLFGGCFWVGALVWNCLQDRLVGVGVLLVYGCCVILLAFGVGVMAVSLRFCFAVCFVLIVVAWSGLFWVGLR